VAVTRTGEWARARAVLERGGQRLGEAITLALRREAHALRNEIVQGLTRQAPGGDPLRQPAELTLAARALRRFGGSKALLVRGDLRNSIGVVSERDEAFIGVMRSRRGPDEKSLVDIARVQEFGSDPVVIPITPAMRRFLAVLMKRAGRERREGSGAGVVVVQVPARPFLRPAFAKFRAGAERRFLLRVADAVGLGGKP
jgi:phage gpG-like protein